LSKFNIKIVRESAHQELQEFLHTKCNKKSQIHQDLFVLMQTNFKRNGFFVEVGAANGVYLSNTYLLEKSFDWTGILIEPAIIWNKSLVENRNVTISTHFVGNINQKNVDFFESSIPEYSTQTSLKDNDSCKDFRKIGKSYQVESKTLDDILRESQAPKSIDYLSIDTEGKDLEILESINFNNHQFNIITCEHNYNPVIESTIFELLSSKGYVQVYKNLSKFESWYVHHSCCLLN
jgi:FkbM family methyltransferase